MRTGPRTNIRIEPAQVASRVGVRPGRPGRRLISVLLGLALLGLTGCAMDSEKTARAQLNSWVILGETTFFQSAWRCTGGVFAVSSDTIKNSIQIVGDVNRGLRMVGEGKAVAFDVKGKAPGQVHQALDALDRFTGVVILVSALAARDCFEGDLADQFYLALNDQDSVLMFDPGNSAMALFDRVGDRIFYARGKI